MLRIVVKSDCLEVLEMSGEVAEIVEELGSVVNAMWNNIRMVNPDAANVFRAMVGLALTTPGVIDHNAFAVVTESPEEPMYKGEERPGWMK